MIFCNVIAMVSLGVLIGAKYVMEMLIVSMTVSMNNHASIWK
jgi:hypothetical protein